MKDMNVAMLVSGGVDSAVSVHMLKEQLQQLAETVLTQKETTQQLMEYIHTQKVRKQ